MHALFMLVIIHAIEQCCKSTYNSLFIIRSLLHLCFPLMNIKNRYTHLNVDICIAIVQQLQQIHVTIGSSDHHRYLISWSTLTHLHKQNQEGPGINWYVIRLKFFGNLYNKGNNKRISTNTHACSLSYNTSHQEMQF